MSENSVKIDSDSGSFNSSFEDKKEKQKKPLFEENANPFDKYYTEDNYNTLLVLK